MDFIRHFKEQQAINRTKYVEEEAKSRIILSDYQGELYISFDHFPLIPIDKTWDSTKALEKLQTVRNSFISYRKHGLQSKS